MLRSNARVPSDGRVLRELQLAIFPGPRILLLRTGEAEGVSGQFSPSGESSMMNRIEPINRAERPSRRISGARVRSIAEERHAFLAAFVTTLSGETHTRGR
jgi:hypothetical protein